jgi:predicted transcriptional regulator
MSLETAEQYVKQEQAALKKRFLAGRQRAKSLLRRMKNDTISTKENVKQLREELAHFYKNDTFLTCKTMGDILILNIENRLGIKVFDSNISR